MKDAPRPPEQPILPRRLLTWVVIAGLVMGVGTLGVIAWATPLYGEQVARTMGLVAFSFFNIFFALETADEDRSAFTPEVLLNGTLLKAVGASVVATVLATELGLLNRILETVSLQVDQWLVCLAVAASLVVVAEVRKLLKIRVTEAAKLAAPAPAPAPAA